MENSKELSYVLLYVPVSICPPAKESDFSLMWKKIKRILVCD
jgi:hypothetical protein